MLAVWVLLVLGFVSLQVLAQARGRVDVATIARTQTVARYAAESGVVVARALLEELVQAAESPEAQARVFGEFERALEAWGVQEIGTGRYQVVVEDLNARVDLNESRDEVLEGLFRQFVGDPRAGELVEALRAWGLDGPAVDALPGEGAEPDDGLEALVRAQMSDRAPIMHLEELALVPGFDPALVFELAPYVTVGSDGRINANSATLPVLAAIPEVGPVAAQTLDDARLDGSPFPSRVALLSAIREGRGGDVGSQLPDLITVPRRILLAARGWEEGHPFTHEARVVLEVRWSQLIRGDRTVMESWVDASR
jgi:type II secretory pathway component PulK